MSMEPSLQIEAFYQRHSLEYPLTDSAFGKWLVWDDTTYIIKVTPNENEQAGNHTLRGVYDDGITPFKYVEWNYELDPDYP